MAPAQLRGSLFIHPDLHRGSLFHGDVLTFFGIWWWKRCLTRQHKLSHRPKGDQLGFHPGRMPSQLKCFIMRGSSSELLQISSLREVKDQGFSFNLPPLLYIAFRELSVSKSAANMSPAVICGVSSTGVHCHLALALENWLGFSRHAWITCWQIQTSLLEV